MNDARKDTKSALDVDFTIRVGQFEQSLTIDVQFILERGVAVLFGPSGAGKTLTLRSLAGLVRPWRGRVDVFETRLFHPDTRIDVPAHERKLGYVPQDQGLFPHLDVLGNVVFGLPRAERRNPGKKVDEVLRELGLSRRMHSRIDSLSGGERQRVALARALLMEPRMLLLDEPLSALDKKARREIQAYLKEVLKNRCLSAVIVTHDAEEAEFLGDVFVEFERDGGTSRARVSASGSASGSTPLLSASSDTTMNR